MTDGEIDELSVRWQNSKEIRGKLKQVLTTELEAAILSSEAKETWTSPNPALILAELAGYRRGLRTIIKLLTQQDKP